MQAIPAAFAAGKKGNAMLWRYFPGRNRADVFYDSLLARSRHPLFYKVFGVPDTRDGRFDLLALHAWLVLERLNEAGETGLAKKLTDRIFSGFEDMMREEGAADGGIFRGLKLLAAAFYGRLQACTDAVRASGGAPDGALAQVIARNLYRGEVAEHAQVMATYTMAVRGHLSVWMPGEAPLDFGPLPD